MGEKRKRVYESMIEGATNGLTDNALYDFIQNRCPNTSGKMIVRASLEALKDSGVKDRNILQVVFALAINERMRGLGAPGQASEISVATPPSTVVAQKKRKVARQKADRVTTDAPPATAS
jgi:hypothetical protein